MLGLAASCLALANCAGGNISSQANHGISASGRMVKLEESVPKGGGASRVAKHDLGRREYVPHVNYNGVVDNVPKLDVSASCRAAATAANDANTRMQTCLDAEQRWHAQLVEQWKDFAPADRVTCVNVQKTFSPTYTELLTCLEMAQKVKSVATQQSLKALSRGTLQGGETPNALTWRPSEKGLSSARHD